MKKVDYIIVGQGIAGTLLSWFLLKAGKSIIVVDNFHHQAASKKAAGVVNPITGRKYIKSWRIEEFLPFAKITYNELAEFLKIVTFEEKLIYRGLYSIKDENTWEARKADPIAGKYIIDEPENNDYKEKVNGIQAYGVLQEGFHTKLPNIIKQFRKKLLTNDQLLEEKFDYSALNITSSKLEYKGVESSNVLFAEGYQAQFNPWFNYLGFEPAKGEALIIKIKGRPFTEILRHKVFISPIDEEHYWVGAGYKWSFEDDLPTKDEYEALKNTLDKILDVPYEIVDHIAGIRPCVKGRRPFLGHHEIHKNLYIFNGLGTKGASLGPYWANHLVEHLINGTDIDPEVSIRNQGIV